jgi:SEC-C motif
MLGVNDLKALVKKAFDQGFIDSHILSFDHFEQDLRHAIERPGEPWPSDNHDYTLFGDTTEELSGWYCFTEDYRRDQQRWRRQAKADRARSHRLENPFKGVGRNDPCPCGSGKKFKRCCLPAVQLGLISPMNVFPDKGGEPFIN